MLLQLFQILCMAHVPSDCIFVRFMYCSTDSFQAKKQASFEEDTFVMYLEPDISGARQSIAHGTCSTITASYVL